MKCLMIFVLMIFVVQKTCRYFFFYLCFSPPSRSVKMSYKLNKWIPVFERDVSKIHYCPIEISSVYIIESIIHWVLKFFNFSIIFLFLQQMSGEKEITSKYTDTIYVPLLTYQKGDNMHVHQLYFPTSGLNGIQIS